MSDFGPAIKMQWVGDALIPADRRWQEAADRQLVIGQTYMIREHAERSKESHNHYFACVKLGWENLPETLVGLDWTRDTETLRKYALIQCGYYETMTIEIDVDKPTIAIAAVMRWIAGEPYFRLRSEGETLIAYKAQSQSRKAMGNEVFQRSKADVIDWIEREIGMEQGGLPAMLEATAR